MPHGLAVGALLGKECLFSLHVEKGTHTCTLLPAYHQYVQEDSQLHHLSLPLPSYSFGQSIYLFDPTVLYPLLPLSPSTPYIFCFSRFRIKPCHKSSCRTNTLFRVNFNDQFSNPSLFDGNISAISSDQTLMSTEIGRYASDDRNNILQAIGGLSQCIDNQLMEIVSAVDKRFNKMDKVFRTISSHFNNIEDSFQIFNHNINSVYSELQPIGHHFD